MPKCAWSGDGTIAMCPYEDAAISRHGAAGKFYCNFHYPSPGGLASQGINYAVEIYNDIGILINRAKELHTDSVEIIGAKFNMSIDLNSIKETDILAELKFSRCHFLQTFSGNQFRIKEQLTFDRCDFFANVDFDRVQNGRDITFATCNFNSPTQLTLTNCTNIGKIIIKDKCKLSGSLTFSHLVSIRSIEISDSELSSVSFAYVSRDVDVNIEKCTFSKDVNFGLCRFSQLFWSNNTAENISFNGTIVLSRFRFTGSNARGVLKFDDHSSIYGSTEFGVCEFSNRIGVSSNCNFIGEILCFKLKPTEIAEDFYRSQKSNMETQRHFWEATQFHAYVMREQWSRLRKGQKWCFSVLTWYGASSKFGSSYWRPLFFGLFIVIPVFWGLFWIILQINSYFCVSGNLTRLGSNYPSIANWPEWIRLFGLSVQSVILPLAFGKELPIVVSNPYVLILSVLESVLSVILVAMTVLTVRRRFRI